MKSLTSLPEGYREIYSVHLQKDKKVMLLINFFAFLIMIAMGVIMNRFVPITSILDFSQGMGAYWLRFGSLIVMLLSYLLLHELVHGIAMKLCGTKKIKYGFTGMYAYAGSDDYYGKKAYIFIALAPVVLWGVVLGVINPFLKPAWFWMVYFVQICNVSGAAGDLFVTAKFARMPKDILIQDSGVGMKVFSRQ